ncbi:OLC1v1000718C1 [Oldenlandia corymbosa var. corymbosa]|uniref:OLC1v1000718C1 n=1 Tax=Oldenlandia corymbosa var. corymbosa TaxID=529605 RepID=A0AAV1D4C5_OLDCO|nr:OLC1v1000718C1 [Oldenlandia corymbosa var. corymbosa]
MKSITLSSDDILTLVNCLVQNLEDLSNLNASIIVSVKNQPLVLQEKLSFLGTLLDLFPIRCPNHQKSILKDFMVCMKDLVHDATTLFLFCFQKWNDEKMARNWGILLSDLLQKCMFCTPEMIISLLKASNSMRSDKFRNRQHVVRLVNFLLEDLAEPLKDYVEVLKEGLIIMITFSMDPEEAAVTDAGDEVFTPISAAINEVLSLFSSLLIGELSVDISSLHGMIDNLKSEITKLYVPILNSSDFHFPRTNRMGFFDFFMEKLQDMVKYHLGKIAFAKHQLVMVHGELLSLEPFLKSNMELQEERDLADLKVLWIRLIDLVFLAEHVISSNLIADHPIWYDILQLYHVIDAIKIIKLEVKKYSDLMDMAVLTSSSHVPIRQDSHPRLEDVVIGLEEETRSIIANLESGTKNLEIVSISGLPGLGKTTIAKKVYNHRSVGYHFSKRAWCCVSLVYNRREMLFDILTDVTGVNARESYAKSTDDNDLADKLRKILKQQRYLIVLDDIWDLKAWDSIKHSLGDDKNGSRIIFTSRIDDLASKATPQWSLHRLRPLSDEESWELLKVKLSHAHDSPLNHERLEITKQIAENCKGLPLTVVLVAGILPGKDIEFWKDVGSQVSNGCMDVIELSYKHLPDKLRPCFLYFGAFPEDRVVRAQKLMSLWIGEGFIPRDGKKSLFKIAEDYLFDLINRNLVIIEERSSIGGIKACRVHDLLHDFCLVKAQDDKFLQLLHDKDISHSSLKLNPTTRNENYRLRINAEWIRFVETKPSGRYVRSLVVVGDEEDEESKGFPCPSDIFNSFRLLNVLDLECIKIDAPFPEEVTLMVNLRYLAIQCKRGDRYVVPSSIAELWKLEILRIESPPGGNPFLPRTFWLMKNLRRVSIGVVVLGDSLNDHEYGPLEHLEKFSTPYLSLGNETEELLDMFPGLRNLKCIFRNSVGVNPDFKVPILSRLTHLESLNVYGSKNLTFGKIDNLSPAFDLPRSLRRLTLAKLKLPWTAISTIGQLPNLEVLKLRWEALSGRSWDVEDGGFQNLKYLELRGLDVEEWTVQDEPFPSLEQLRVYRCPNLGEIPSGLGSIITLKMIQIAWCTSQAARSAEEILEQQLEMNNDLQFVARHCN